MPDTFDCPCCSPVLGQAYRMHHPAEQAPAKTFLTRRSLMGNAALGALLVAAAPAFAAPGGPETRVFVGATVLPVDAGFSEAEALAIRGDKVLAVGGKDAVLKAAGPGATIVDVSGKTILPGFVEPHFHYLFVAMLGQWENVGAIRYADVEAVVARLRQVAKTKKPGEWILAYEVDPSLQKDGDKLTAAVLDTVSRDNPVLVLNASLHFGYCNSKALALAAITRETADPPAAHFLRHADGTPNGVLEGGGAMLRVFKVVDAMANLDLVQAGLAVCARANKAGITTFCDQGTGLFHGKADLDIYRAIAATGRMSVRLRYSISDALAATWDGMDVAFGKGDAMVRMIGWKIVSDGSNQGRTGLQREPYLGTNDTGMAYVDAAALKEKVEKRLRQGWQVVIHGNGDKAIDNILDAYELAKAHGAPMDKRPRIEHCSILHDGQIARMKALGVSPSFLIGHVYYWGKAFRDEIFGPQKAMLLDRVGSCEAQGITWTLHSDAPVTELSPLRYIHNAVTRQMWREPQSVLAPKERVSVAAAIRAMTRDAAWQCHCEHEVGSLEPGKYADFIVLPADPRKIDPYTIKDLAVEQTWMNGRRVYQA